MSIGRYLMLSVLRGVSVSLLAMALSTAGLACNTYHISMITPASSIDDEAEAKQMYLEMNLPVVLVKAETGTGSGVVFGDGTLCLTAAHVVSHQSVATDENGNPTELPPTIEKVVVQHNGALKPYISGTEVVKIDYTLDLAVLKLAVSYPYRAAFASVDPYLYQKCWASGHPHGITDPIVTEGRITDLWMDGHIMYSCPTTFGNSGCPVFVKIDRHYVVSTVCQMVEVEGYGIAVTHLGFGCLPDHMRDFLAEIPGKVEPLPKDGGK